MTVFLSNLKNNKGTLVGYLGLTTRTQVYTLYDGDLRGTFLFWKKDGEWVHLYSEKVGPKDYKVINYTPVITPTLNLLIHERRAQVIARKYRELLDRLRSLLD